MDSFSLISLSIAAVSLIVIIIQTKYSRQQLKIGKEKNQKLEELFSENDELLGGMDAMYKMNLIINEEYKSLDQISIRNMGLDLETVMPWLRNKVLTSSDLRNTPVDYKGLIINPESSCVKDFINGTSNVKKKFVEFSLESADSIKEMNISNIKIEIKSYQCLPIIYGFILNDKHLFLGFTEIIDGKIMGGTTPYIYLKFNKTSKLNVHYFNMFNSWFNKFWGSSNTIIKIIK
jgi:hypothetical protein